MFKKLRTVIYHTDNLQKAKAWYINITGIQPYFDEPFYVGFDINGFELGLDPDLNGLKKGNQSVAFWSVDNIEECIKKLVEGGGIIKGAVRDVGEGIKVAVVNDPFGNSVGLIEET
ncbi:MAG: VOC family protein [Ferruginibacter sp.]